MASTSSFAHAPTRSFTSSKAKRTKKTTLPKRGGLTAAPNAFLNAVTLEIVLRRCRYRHASIEVTIEKPVQALTCILRCLAVVFQPVIKHRSAGLEVLVIESMVRAGIDDEFDRRPLAAPVGDFIGAVCRRRPIVERPNEDQRPDAPLPACREGRTQPPRGTASCLQRRTVRTNWSPQRRG